MGNVTTAESSTQSPPPTGRKKFSTSPSMESSTQWKHPANKVLPDEKPSSPLRPLSSVEATMSDSSPGRPLSPVVDASMSDWRLFASQTPPLDSSSFSHPWSSDPWAERQPVFSFSNVKGDLRGQPRDLGNSQTKSLEKRKYSANRNVPYPLHGSNHLEYRSNAYIGDYPDNKALFSPITSPSLEPANPRSFRRNNLYRKKYRAPSPPGVINHHNRSQGSVRKRWSSPKARRQARYKKRQAPAPPNPGFYASNDAVSSQSDMLETPRSSGTVPEPEVDYSDDENEICYNTTKQTHDTKSIVTISPPHSRPGTPPPPIPPKMQPLLTPSPAPKVFKTPEEGKPTVDEFTANPASVSCRENLPSPYETLQINKQNDGESVPSQNDKILGPREEVRTAPVAPPLPQQLTWDLNDASRDVLRNKPRDSNVSSGIPPPPPLPFFKMNQLSIGHNVTSPNNVQTKDDIPILPKPKPKSTVEKVVKPKTLHEKFKEELEGVFAFRNARRVRRQTEPKPKKTSIKQSEKTQQAQNEPSEHDADQILYNREDVSDEIIPESKTPQHKDDRNRSHTSERESTTPQHKDDRNRSDTSERESTTPQHKDDRNRSHTSELATIDQQFATTNEQNVADKPDHSSKKTKIRPKRDNQKQTETATSILNPLQITAMLNELKDSMLLVDETDQQTPGDNRAIDDNIKDSRSSDNTDNRVETEKTNRSLLPKELTDSVVLVDDTEGDHVMNVIKAPDTAHNTDWTPQDDLDSVTLDADSQSDGRRRYQKKVRPGNKSGNSKEGSLSSKTSNNTSRKSKTESKRFQKSVVKAFDSIKRVITSRRNSSESDTCNDEKQTISCICDLDLHQRHHSEACPHSSPNKHARHVSSGANNDMVIHTNNREKDISGVENVNQKGIYKRQRSFSASCIEIQKWDEEIALNQSHNDNSGSRTKKEKSTDCDSA